MKKDRKKKKTLSLSLDLARLFFLFSSKKNLLLTSEGRAMHDTSAGMNFSMSMLSTVLHTVESAAIAASLTC